ncbi:uncharacterized protein LOC115376229 [Myripristis murdjan]|uniref:uncharacterized protein LOC115376229 n=1 Tax=Myripristis murdjan TaxID=586833 RepID=UPI001175DEEC|nr:uncharacterized protein LOC115376229 [Myripristis murdjan]
MIEKAGDNTYKICFMQKEDQERVLNRKFHTILLPRGELSLTVTRTNVPQNPQLTDQQSTSQQQTFTKVNTKELEKVYPLETYLLYYLRDSPKVFKVLQKQLSAIGCTIQLNPEEEEAVVSGSAEKGPSGASDAAATWELQVDCTVVGFIENYLCYHVFEPEKAKILLQDFSSMTEDIRVYKDEGYVVVVGEVQVVREKMDILEKNLPIKKECLAPQKQFNLIEEEFSHEITACCPNIKILWGGSTIDNYQHPLFFEAKDLTDQEKEKLRRHFQKKRDSGGGECGMIEKVGDNTYKIGFMHKEDQERVLNRKFHTVSLPRGELCLTVTRTNVPDNPQLTDQQSTSQQQTFTKVNTKELEKVYPLEIYLLYYLRDSPKVFRVLQKQLSAIGCTIQLNPEEEEAVVSGSAEKGPSGASDAAATWELQVDSTVVGFIENYLCYHVFEPEKAKILLQDFSSMTEDIRVYKDEGYVVVVGEVQVVREKMAILEKNLPIKKECSAPEKQFNLVEEEFSREITACYPNIKILRGKPNTIILEGPEKEVQLFSTKLDELIKRVKEKRVPLPTVLLNFITSSGVISKYKAHFKQSLCSPVALETGSDLVLSSLSSDALEEAAAAVQRDLCMDTIQLEGTLAVAPDLDRVKEVLTKAKNEANCAGLRVEVNFNPAASATPKIQVQLVGYSADVGKLKAVLTDYQLNQAEVQQQLNLQLPEIVDNFDEILALIGMKRPTVNLTASHSPNPCVFLSGPRSRVQETHQALQAALGTLVWDNLVLDGPGAQQYFQKEGKRSMELVESSCQVLIREQVGSMSSQNIATAPNLNTRQRNSSIPSQSNTASASTSRWRCNTTSSTGANVPGNKIILEIKIGDLGDVQVDVLVVPIIKAQLKSTNIGISLLNKAGNTLKSTFDVMMGGRNFTPGDVLQVDGPRSLSCSKIFFVECLPWDGSRAQSAKTLSTGLRKCLDLCGQQGWVSVALPIIGPGLALNYPLREAVEVLTHTIGRFGCSGSTGSLSTIHIVIKPGYPDSEDCYHDVYSQLSIVMSQGGQVLEQRP